MTMIPRRTLLKLAAGLPALAAGASALAAKAVKNAKTYVLAHGSWHGGGCWRPVADRLQAAGHRVYAPSYTGMGDRARTFTARSLNWRCWTIRANW